MADEDERNHLDEEGRYAGHVVWQETCPESTGRALAYPVFPHEEIGKGIVGENGTLEGYRWGHKETDEFIFGEEHFGQKPHHGTIHGRSAKSGDHELEVSDQLFHFPYNRY